MILMLSSFPKEMMIPKWRFQILIKTRTFIGTTGAHAGALLGCQHDRFQSGGLETPAHDRVEAGDIHKAHKVLPLTKQHLA